MGVLTLCICIPQLLDVVYTGSIAKALGVEYVIFLGAVWSLLAALATRWLDVPEQPAGDASCCDTGYYALDDAEDSSDTKGAKEPGPNPTELRTLKSDC